MRRPGRSRADGSRLETHQVLIPRWRRGSGVSAGRPTGMADAGRSGERMASGYDGSLQLTWTTIKGDRPWPQMSTLSSARIG